MILICSLHNAKLVASNTPLLFMTCFSCAALEKAKKKAKWCLSHLIPQHTPTHKDHSLVWGIHASTRSGPKTKLSVWERRK